MSQRLVMNYRHSSLGQWFTPSPCQEGRRIAGSLGLEEAALRFPVPAAGSPQHGRQQRQKERGRRELKDPKYLPALGHRPPFPGAAASALSVGRSQAPREAQDTQMPKDTCRSVAAQSHFGMLLVWCVKQRYKVPASLLHTATFRTQSL